MDFTNTKARFIRDCAYGDDPDGEGQPGNLEARWVSLADQSVSEPLFRNYFDSGALSGAGALCFRSTTGLDVIVEQY